MVRIGRRMMRINPGVRIGGVMNVWDVNDGHGMMHINRVDVDLMGVCRLMPIDHRVDVDRMNYGRIVYRRNGDLHCKRGGRNEYCRHGNGRRELGITHENLQFSPDDD